MLPGVVPEPEEKSQAGPGVIAAVKDTGVPELVIGTDCGVGLVPEIT